MSPPPEIVSLEHAWFWSCPICAHGNYVRSVKPSTEDVRELLDLEPWESVPAEMDGEFIAAPEVVTCSGCRKTFDCFDDVPGPVPDGVPPDL